MTRGGNAQDAGALQKDRGSFRKTGGASGGQGELQEDRGEEKF